MSSEARRVEEGLDPKAKGVEAAAYGARAHAGRWAAYVACAAALAYALPHLWWGLGIPWAFPGDFSDTPAQPWMRALAFWGMGALALFGALFALALVKPWGRILPRRLLLVPPRWRPWDLPSGASVTSTCGTSWPLAASSPPRNSPPRTRTPPPYGASTGTGSSWCGGSRSALRPCGRAEHAAELVFAPKPFPIAP
jgi:hypothetical protein